MLAPRVLTQLAANEYELRTSYTCRT